MITLFQSHLFKPEKARLLSHLSQKRNVPLMLMPTSTHLMASLPKLKSRLMAVAPTLILTGVIALLLSSEAIAMKADTMQAGLTTLEGFLTGNVTRLMVIGGAAFGAFQAFMKQQPALLLGAVGIGLGINFLQSWLSETWTLLL